MTGRKQHWKQEPRSGEPVQPRKTILRCCESENKGRQQEKGEGGKGEG